MKNHFTSRFIAMLLCLAFAVSLFSGLTVSAAVGTVSRNTATRHVVCDSLSTKAEAYYTGNYTYDVLSQLSGVSSPNNSWTTTQNNELYTALQTLMSSTHKVYTEYNPSGEQNNELSYLWDYTDASAGSSEYLYFYTDVTADSYGTSDMQREHVWPKSNASFYQTNGGSDLHHLRPSIGTVNNAKSNYTFANVRENYSSYSTCSVNSQAVIWYNGSSGVLEVRDNVKGDVARILLYVYCRWGQPNLYSDVSSAYLPTMDSDDSSNNGVRAIDDLDTLLEWMEIDPVDDWEMSRNDQTENYQGNRNVFIDYPEFAWLLFNQTPPTTMQTPSGEAAGGTDTPTYTITATTNNSDYGTVSLSGKTITATPKSGYEVSGYTIVSGTATVSQNGNVFTVIASSDCTIRINFSKIVYTVTATVNGSEYGSVTVDEYTITAFPNDGYQVSGYTLVSGSATVSRNGNIFTVTPATNCTICINFSPITYSVTASSNDTSYGTVSVSGYTITATPKTGYEVSGYTLISGTATVTQNGNVFTVSPTSDCVILITFSKIVYTVTATVNSSAYGSVSVDGYVITAAPNDGYWASGYTVVSGSATVTQEGNVFTVDPTSNCTIRINFASTVGYTIDFSVPAGVTQDPISGYSEEVITLPTPSGSPTADAYEYTFIGWTTAESVGTTVKPTVYSAGSSYTITDNVTLYALYSYTIEGSGESHYSLVTDAAELHAGANVVIASTNADYAISTSQSSSSRGAAAITKDSANQTISFSGSVCVFELVTGSLDSTWAFYDSTNNGYLYASSSRSNALQTQSTVNDNASFLITISNGNATMTAQGSNTRNTLGYYTYFSNYFTCFSSVSSSRGYVQLYMMTSTDTVYYTTVPQSNCTHNYVATTTQAPTCTTAGTSTFTCSLCGSSYTDSIEALGHNYTYTSTVSPTQSEQGYDIYTCSNCGLTQNQNYTEPTGYNYTVSFSVPTGVAPIADMQSNTLSGITLPTPSGAPTNDQNSATFLGWGTISIDNAVTVDTYYKAGSNYTALSNITLYALYQYSVSDGTAEAFAPGSEGDFVLAAYFDGAYYAIPNSFTLTSGKIYGTAIEVTDGTVTDSNAANYTVKLEYDGSAYYTISNGTYYLAYSGSSTNFAESITEPYNWTISSGTNGSWRVCETTSTTPRAIAFYNYSTSSRFGVYSTSNITASSTAFFDLEILPVSGSGSTTYYTTIFHAACSHEITTTETVPADCTSSGSITVTCTSCNEIISTETIAELGHTEVIDAAVAATCTATGLTEGKHCSVCNEVLLAQEEIAASGHNYTYTDNGENHTVTCAKCDYAATESHSYVDGGCICGAVESTAPTYVSNPNLTLTMSISVGAEMQVIYNVLNSKIKSFESFYIEVVKDVVGGESVTTIFSLDNDNLTAATNASGAISRYMATYTGIFAMEMGDNFTATVYAVAADGTINYGPSASGSIKTLLMEKLADADSSDELKTLAVDMLNYGAAAQINFDYDVENLVNADLTEEQKALGTQTIPEAVDGSTSTETGGRVVTSVSVQSKVMLYLTFIYKATDDSDLKVVIKDAANGNILSEYAPSEINTNNCKAVYDNVGARQMRDLITIELYDNGTLVSRTVTWSVESYVAQTRADSTSSEALINAVNAMLAYGDSAAVYLESTGQ